MRLGTRTAVPRARRLALGAWPIILAACSFTSLDDLQSGGGGPSSAATGGDQGNGASSVASSTSTTTTGSNGTGGDAGSGGGGGGGGTGGEGSAGGGGSSPTLADTGLLVRYFVDDAAGGTGPTHVTDAATSPLDLSLDYAEGMGFVTEAGHRGLGWESAGAEGIAAIPVAGSKVFALDQSVYGTIEVVTRVESADFYGSRLLHIGTGSESSFTMAVSHPDEVAGVAPPTTLQLRTKARSMPAPFFRYAFFEADFAAGRTVFHAVYDTREEEPKERVRMYQNGVRLEQSSLEPEEPPEADEALFLDPADLLSLGNRLVGDRSIGGTIFYGAVYLAALTDDEIARNVRGLLAADDR